MDISIIQLGYLRRSVQPTTFKGLDIGMTIGLWNIITHLLRAYMNGPIAKVHFVTRKSGDLLGHFFSYGNVGTRGLVT